MVSYCKQTWSIDRPWWTWSSEHPEPSTSKEKGQPEWNSEDSRRSVTIAAQFVGEASRRSKSKENELRQTSRRPQWGSEASQPCKGTESFEIRQAIREREWSSEASQRSKGKESFEARQARRQHEASGEASQRSMGTESFEMRSEALQRSKSKERDARQASRRPDWSSEESTRSKSREGFPRSCIKEGTQKGATVQMESLKQGAAFFLARTRAESVTKQSTETLLKALCKAYSCCSFQASLAAIFRCADPSTRAYKDQMSALLSSVRDKVLLEHGLPDGQEGEILLVLVSDLHMADPKVNELVLRIDTLLCKQETPAQNTHVLTKAEVLEVARLQIAAFSARSFRNKLDSLMQENRQECELADGIRELKQARLGPILRQYDMQPNAHGAQELLNQTARYIMDPNVATRLFVINALLGLDEATNVKFIDGLGAICAGDPNAKKEEEKHRAGRLDARVTKIVSKLTGIRLKSFTATFKRALV